MPQGPRTVGASVVLAFLGAVAAVEAWAVHARDADFVLPDPFHPLVLGALAVFAAGVLLRASAARTVCFTLALAVPVGLVAYEARLASRGATSQRLEVTSDPLLRYRYRPGPMPSRLPDAAEPDVTPEGLWDLPHALERRADTWRVVVLGDSVPNDGSIAFEARFPRRLEALLAERAPAGRRVEVMNVSCEGYNTQQEVRLFETVGRKYRPDLVVVAYVLNDPFLQNGAYRRMGNSYFTFTLGPLAQHLAGGSMCGLFAPMHQGYSFDLVVRQSLERLRLLAEADGFRVLVAPLPIVERFDDPICLGLYDQVQSVARAQGFAVTRVADAFRGEDPRRYAKPNERFDVTHPNAAGHERIAQSLADAVLPLLPLPR